MVKNSCDDNGNVTVSLCKSKCDFSEIPYVDSWLAWVNTGRWVGQCFAEMKHCKLYILRACNNRGQSTLPLKREKILHTERKICRNQFSLTATRRLNENQISIISGCCLVKWLLNAPKQLKEFFLHWNVASGKQKCHLCKVNALTTLPNQTVLEVAIAILNSRICGSQYLLNLGTVCVTWYIQKEKSLPSTRFTKTTVTWFVVIFVCFFGWHWSEICSKSTQPSNRLLMTANGRTHLPNVPTSPYKSDQSKANFSVYSCSEKGCQKERTKEHGTISRGNLSIQ